MAHFLNTTRLCDTAVDDVTGDVGLLYDAAGSSLWDFPADVREFSDVNAWSDVLEDDSVLADILNETDEYPERCKASDDTMAKSTELTFGNPRPLVSTGFRRNLSKNAILARENREKKKRYICGLEKTVRDLSAKNKKLVHGCAAMRKTVADLHREVNYLRGVLENQSELARLLKHIPIADPACRQQSDTGNSSSCNEMLPLSASSLDSRELIGTESVPPAGYDCSSVDHDYARPERQNKRHNSSHHQFGVCLHVVNQATSLQLCARCNENAEQQQGAATPI